MYMIEPATLQSNPVYVDHDSHMSVASANRGRCIRPNFKFADRTYTPTTLVESHSDGSYVGPKYLSRVVRHSLRDNIGWAWIFPRK